MTTSERCSVDHWTRTYGIDKLGVVLSLKKSDPGDLLFASKDVHNSFDVIQDYMLL